MELLRAIPGMAATIARQSQELAELKQALQKIIQAFSPAPAAATLPHPGAVALLRLPETGR